MTIEDIVEEIIGEFTTQAPGGSEIFRREADGSVVVDGMALLRTLNRRLGTQFPLDGPKTLNGLIVEHLGDIPEAGVGFSLDGQSDRNPANPGSRGQGGQAACPGRPGRAAFTNPGRAGIIVRLKFYANGIGME